MNANGWSTLTVDDAERRLARGLRRLGAIQADIDAWDSAGVPVPADVLDAYEEAAHRLSAFADAWGFDIGDVDMCRLVPH